jgi:hypothetical protein
MKIHEKFTLMFCSSKMAGVWRITKIGRQWVHLTRIDGNGQTIRIEKDNEGTLWIDPLKESSQ